MLSAKEIYVVKNGNRMMGCNRVTPITVFGFSSKKLAHDVRKLIVNKHIDVLPCAPKVFDIHIDSDGKGTLIKEGNTVVAVPLVYFIMLAKLNRINALTFDTMRVRENTVTLISNEMAILFEDFNDPQMIRGNLEKIFMERS
jgi:uncharacterized membrane protein